MTDLFFVRHGETESNVLGLLHGRTDVPLSDRGRAQARQVAEHLAVQPRFDQLYSSPLSRAADTARTIGDALGMRPAFVEELAEFHFGDFEGYTLDQIINGHPEVYVRIQDLQDDDFRFPRGESRSEFHMRVRAAVHQLLLRHAGERLVVVAHGGVIGSAVAQLTDADANDWGALMVHNCSITHLELHGTSVVELRCWNDVAHLQPDLEEERSG